jgi:hypothetical protein
MWPKASCHWRRVTLGRVVKARSPTPMSKIGPGTDARQLTFDHGNTPLDPEITEILAFRK